MPRRRLLRLFATGLLLAGLLGGALLALRAGSLPEAASYAVGVDGEARSVSPLDSRVVRRDLELYGGKSAIWLAELDEWLQGISRGRGLAAFVAIVCGLGAAALFWAAERPDPPGDDA
jgi:hypothetical protein